MKTTSYHISRKFQIGPDDTFERLQKIDAPRPLKLWAASVIWFNGGLMEQFDLYSDDCPRLGREFEDDFEAEVSAILENVGFSLSSTHWPTKRSRTLSNC